LELQLQSILNVLVDAEIKCESNPEIRKWLQQIKVAAYRADNVLDLFRYMALRKKAEIGESKLTKIQNKFVQNSLLDRASLSMELKSVTDMFNGLTMEMQRFNLLVGSSEPVYTLERNTFSTEGPSTELFGRKNDQETIVKLLLAQENHETVEVLKGKLVEAISNRRFLLVMDDVCSAKLWEEKLEQILSWIAAPGSCVIVTTRSRQVALAMGTLRTHYLDLLGKEEAWELFEQKAFSKEVEVS
ncbi:putative disease resistance protein RGA3, partial [Panicum miliaceum]